MSSVGGQIKLGSDAAYASGERKDGKASERLYSRLSSHECDNVCAYAEKVKREREREKRDRGGQCQCKEQKYQSRGWLQQGECRKGKVAVKPQAVAVAAI